MSSALLGAPLARIRAETTNRSQEATFAGTCLSAQQAQVDTFPAAARAVVVTPLIDHRIQADFAGRRAFLAGLDTGLMLVHESPRR